MKAANIHLKADSKASSCQIVKRHYEKQMLNIDDLDDSIHNLCLICKLK